MTMFRVWHGRIIRTYKVTPTQSAGAMLQRRGLK
jgi:hypothetical protein